MNSMSENEVKIEGQETDRSKMEPEFATLREQHLRLAAEFDNHRKRTARESERRAASQKEALVRDLLPAIDNLERALAAKAVENLREGVQMIYQQVIETLRRH